MFKHNNSGDYQRKKGKPTVQIVCNIMFMHSKEKKNCAFVNLRDIKSICSVLLTVLFGDLTLTNNLIKTY